MENIQFLGWSMGHGPHSSTNPLYCSRAENKLLSRDILTAHILQLILNLGDQHMR